MIESKGKLHMLISDKQKAANRENAQHSSGPKTPEGKAAVRFNALTWTLRATSLILPDEDHADYQQLWNNLEEDWQPQNHTERLYLDQMANAQWRLTRMAASEGRVYETKMPFEERLTLLDRISVERTRLERSFTTGLHELNRLQTKRQARPQPQPAPAAKAAPAPDSKPAEPRAPHPDCTMSDAKEAHPVNGAPATPDTR